MSSVKMRQRVERLIARRVVVDLVAAGYALNIDNGGDALELPAPSTDGRAVLRAMTAADEDRLYVYRPRKDGFRVHPRCGETAEWQNVGWVLFVYGNDGYDVVSDYTVNLEALMAGARALAERYGG